MKKTTVAKVFATANADINDALKRTRNQKEQLANAKSAMKPFMSVILALLDKADRMYIYTGYSKPQILISMQDLDSFKQGRIINVLQAFEVFGTCTSTRDWASSINRDFHYDMPEFTVSLHAYVKEDSATCRKVAVGTEVQTVVKYEIQCD